MKTYHFLAGLPRSGSTLLCSILNQNPSVYATPTSPLLELMFENQNAWHKNQAVIANPFPDQLTNMTKAMIAAAWEHRSEPIIIDKCRGWVKNQPASTILFGRDVKTIFTDRDLPSIMASWLSLFRQQPERIGEKFRQGLQLDEAGLLDDVWQHMVKDCIECRPIAKHNPHILTIRYDQLMINPLEVLDDIELFLSLPPYKYDFDNITSNTNDDDLAAWGLKDMHTIRPKLQKISKNAKDVLGEKLFNHYTMLEMPYL